MDGEPCRSLEEVRSRTAIAGAMSAWLVQEDSFARMASDWSARLGSRKESQVSFVKSPCWPEVDNGTPWVSVVEGGYIEERCLYVWLGKTLYIFGRKKKIVSEETDEDNGNIAK
jgi:hypothetical protein